MGVDCWRFIATSSLIRHRQRSVVLSRPTHSRKALSRRAPLQIASMRATPRDQDIHACTHIETRTPATVVSSTYQTTRSTHTCTGSPAPGCRQLYTAQRRYSLRTVLFTIDRWMHQTSTSIPRTQSIHTYTTHTHIYVNT